MYNVRNVGDVWECDLADFRQHKKYNDNFQYVFVCTDVLSKYVYAEPILNKKAQTVAEAFGKILSRCKHRLPIFMQGDRGKEFLESDFQKSFGATDLISGLQVSRNIIPLCRRNF